jgi:NADH:ubiquinone oxidoreductase subunit H
MTVAFVTIAERKIMAAMQRRCGPNAVGIWGILQPFADALKLLVKEIIIPRQSNSMLFVIGPCITLIFALLGWAIIPFGEGLAIFDYDLGVFFALAVSSIGSYGILVSGWAANSKYAFMGAIRSTAQLLSYELVFSSIVLILIIFSGSFSLTFIVECQQAVWNIFPLLPIALMFFIAILAETNRPPFDLPEARFGHKKMQNSYIWFCMFLFSSQYAERLNTSSYSWWYKKISKILFNSYVDYFYKGKIIKHIGLSKNLQRLYVNIIIYIILYLSIYIYLYCNIKLLKIKSNSFILTNNTNNINDKFINLKL